MIKRICDRCGADITASLYWVIKVTNAENSKSTTSYDVCNDCKTAIVGHITDND